MNVYVGEGEGGGVGGYLSVFSQSLCDPHSAYSSVR